MSVKIATVKNARKHTSMQNPMQANHTNATVSGHILPMYNQPHFLHGTGSHSLDLLSCFILFFVCLHVVVSSHAAEEEFPKEKCEAALPECQCDEGYVDMVELTCRNVSNFETFSQTLSDGSVFVVNATYDITLSGVRVLPSGFLKGLIVDGLYLYDIQTEVVEDGAFDGMLQLKKFEVQLSSIKEIPDLRTVRDSLRTLNLDNSRLASISGDQLKNLSKLETISFVNNSIQTIASDAFEGTENIMIFDLSYNQLKTLPQDLFNPWKKLFKVSLTSNQLLHVDQLFAVTHPKFIYLNHNNLTELDSILHPDMHEVETVLLSYNPISRITENSFNGKVKNAASVFMDHCLVREFNASHFKDLSILSTLDLSYNLIENVNNQTIQFGSEFGHGVELFFSGNKIREFNVNLTYKVKHLDLNKNLMTSVSRSLQYSQALDINMAENRIETLGPEDFHGMQGIQNVNLEGNLISKIDPLTFKGIRRSLVHLDLSRNNIRSLQGCVQNLYLLTSMNLTYNKIESFEEDEFQGLDELLNLYLDGNLITTLGNEMQRLSQLQYLSIINNRISTLNPEQIPQTSKFIYLKGNPFKCDCQFLPFLQYLNDSSVGTDVPLCTPSNLTSLLPPAVCPDGCHCSCTQDNKDKHFMSVDCSSAGLTELPRRLFTEECSSIAKENCSTMAINLPRHTQFSQSGPFAIEDEIVGVNLADNNLLSLEGAHLPDRMQILFLGNNHLKKLPLPMLYSLRNLKKLTLSGNPWSCGCETLYFKDWLLYKSEIITDANETRCGSDSPGLDGRVLWSLTDMDFCPVSIGSSTSLIIGLLCFFLVLAILAIVLMVHWTKVKMWLFRHRVTCFHKYGVIQNKEAQNLLDMNGQQNNQRGSGAEGLASFPLPDDDLLRQERHGIQAELHSSFEEGPIDRLSTDQYVSLTAQSKLPV